VINVVGKKGTSWDKAASSSEEIKPMALSIVELHLAEGNSYLVSRNLGNITTHWKF